MRITNQIIAFLRVSEMATVALAAYGIRNGFWVGSVGLCSSCSVL